MSNITENPFPTVFKRLNDLMKKICCLSALFCFTTLTAAELPILGIAHVAYKSSSLEISRAFYTGMLGYEKAFASGSDASEAWYFKVNDDQFVKLVHDPDGIAEDRLLEVALQVTDANLIRKLLLESGLDPTPVEIRSDGTLATILLDPDGHQVAFVEYTADSLQNRDRGRHLGARRASDRLWHTGISVADESKARAFYEHKLGGREFWRGGPEGQDTRWINVRLPGERGDYIEYMLLNGATPTRERLSSMHHVCFQASDLRLAHRELCSHGLQDIERYHPRIGRNGYWLCNVYDPDDTRLELMESQVIPALATLEDGNEVHYYGTTPGALEAAKARLATGDARLSGAFEQLMAEASEALKTRPPTVMDKTRPGASGNLHDYATQAPYLWPDPASPTGLPYIPRDGVVNPESRHPDNSDHERAALLGRTVGTLALAYYFSGREEYAEHAARCLRVWFLDPATRMNPNMNFAQAVPGRNIGRGIGLIEAGGVVEAIDSAGLLNGSHAWTRSDIMGLQAWVEDFLDWILLSQHGRDEEGMRQNHGTFYDVRVVRLALSAGRVELARQILSAAPVRRIALQIEPDGAQSMELRRTKSFNYSTMNLGGMVNLAALGQHVQVDLWHYETADGRSIRGALDFMLSYVTDDSLTWPYEQIVPIDRAAWAPIYWQAAIAYQDPRYEEVAKAFQGMDGKRFHLLCPMEVDTRPKENPGELSPHRGD